MKNIMDLVDTCVELGFNVIGFDEEGAFEMRPAERLFGGPIGVISIECTGVDRMKVNCRNGLTKEINSFVTNNDIAGKIADWKAGGKGNIQDYIPELDVELREMCISGMNPEDWKDI